MNEIAKQVIRWIKIAVGFLLVIIGIIGGFVPIMQGWMFVLPGLAILATEFTWAKKINDRVKSTFRSAIARARARREQTRADESGQKDLPETDG